MKPFQSGFNRITIDRIKQIKILLQKIEKDLR